MDYEKKEEILEEEIKRERSNLNDEIYINLVRFLGAMTILAGAGVLIYNSMRFSVAVYVLFTIGLAIVGGAELWAYDNRRSMQKIIRLKKDLEEENTEE